MNREIKFRAWDSIKKEWLLGYGEGTLGGFSLDGELMLLGEWSRVLDDAFHDKIDLKVMQYTGLKDTNGKETYEGDVVEITTSVNAPKERKAVYWVPDSAAWSITNFYPHEIIGNIWENPAI